MQDKGKEEKKETQRELRSPSKKQDKNMDKGEILIYQNHLLAIRFS